MIAAGWVPQRIGLLLSGAPRGVVQHHARSISPGGPLPAGSDGGPAARAAQLNNGGTEGVSGPAARDADTLPETGHTTAYTYRGSDRNGAVSLSHLGGPGPSQGR
ncbi:hypothetical protein GCM10025784_24420 [Citricoccus nitrophenolicus]